MARTFRRMLATGALTLGMLTGVARAQTQMARPIGVDVGYFHSPPGWCQTAAGGLVADGVGHEFVTTVGWWSWPTPGGLAGTPDAYTFYYSTGNGNAPPVLGTSSTDIPLIYNYFNLYGDMQLIYVNPSAVSAVQWGIGIQPSNYIRDPVLNEYVVKAGPTGVQFGTVLNLYTKINISFYIGGRAPGKVFNLCDLNNNQGFIYYDQVATTIDLLGGGDLGSWIESTDTTWCHHPELAVIARNYPLYINGHSLLLAMGSRLTNDFTSLGVHVAGGLWCGTGSLARKGSARLMDVQLVTPAPEGPTFADPKVEAQFQDYKRAHPQPPPLSAVLQDQYDRAGAVVNDRRNDAVTAGVPFHAMHPDIENGKVVIVIEVQGQLTPNERGMIESHLERGKNLGGFPVVIVGQTLPIHGASGD